MKEPVSARHDWVYGLVAVITHTVFGAALIACALGTVLVVAATGCWILLGEMSPETQQAAVEAVSAVRPNWRRELQVSYVILGIYWVYMAYLTGRDALSPR